MLSYARIHGASADERVIMRWDRKLVAVSCAIGASLCVAVAQPGAVSAANGKVWPDPCDFASATNAEVQTCFNDPTEAGWDNVDGEAIFQSLGALIQKTDGGDTLRIMLYHWPKGQQDPKGKTEKDTLPEELASEVVDARGRGVDVQVILDERSEDVNTDDQPIDILRSGNVPVAVCRDASDGPLNDPPDCLMFEDKGGNAPLTHTKLFLAEIGGVPYIAAGSSNLSTWDHNEAWNDFVRVRGDEQLYGWLTDWYDRVWADDWTGWNTNAERDRSGDPGSGGDDLPNRAWVYPREGSGDPIVGQLANVTDCSSDGDGDGDWDKRVWVAMSRWYSNREGVVGQLDRLDAAGCDVQVLLGGGVSEFMEEKIRTAVSGDPNAWGEVRRVCKLHYKYIVLDAKYQGVWHEVVITGSEILTRDARRNSNELNLRIGGDNDAAVRDYITQTQELFEKAPDDRCG